MLNAAQITEKATLETVTEIYHWTDALFSFKTTRPSGYTFTPGQYARLGLSDERGMLWRAFSIVSATDQPFLEFFAIEVEGGAFSAMLMKLREGDPICVEKQSYGFMTVDRFSDGDDLWMLATGTGLGPYVSIAQDALVWEKFNNLIVVHCVRHADELAYQDQLLELKNKPPFNSLPAELQLIQSVTREQDRGEHAGRLHGRITTLLENGELEKHAGIPITVEASRVMICGNPQMIDDTRRILHKRGLSPCRRVLAGQFVTENYW
ncbi:MAG TPA: ferredoxin--NADP reductase [Burkholderiaceae bacterium]|jgi:ferredoxin--NADP+ reductase